MKKLLLTIVIGALLISCKDNEESNLKKMKIELEKEIKDDAFKNNLKVEIYQLEAISYDTVTENYVDTLHIISASNNLQQFIELHESNMKLAKLKSNQIRIYRSIGSSSLEDIDREELQDYLDEAKRYLDSMKVYRNKDSSIREQIKKRSSPENVYRAKFFIKATTHTKNGESNNNMDTTYIFFNKDLKLIKVNHN
jgi:Mg2+ and Co2+ transporter CorA